MHTGGGHGTRRIFGAAAAAGALALAAGCASTRTAARAGDAADGAPAGALAAAAKQTPVQAPAPPAPAPSPDVQHPNEFSSPELGFALDKPAGEDWAMATDVTSPEGRPIPVVVAHPESGAQIVVQVSKPMGPPSELADMLRGKLAEEKSLKIGETAKVSNDSGLDAWGFPFAVQGEAKGRVAIIQVGETVVLVVASWPEAADKKLVQQVDSVVNSVRAASDTEPTISRPDKA